MKKYSTRFKISVSIIFLGIAGALFIGLISSDSPSDNSPSDKSPSEKKTISRLATWPLYSFESATSSASTIIRGKVTSKSNTKIYQAIDNVGNKHDEYYREVTVEVIDVIKGNISGNTITYLEMGGETDDMIFILEDAELVEPDSEYIFFLNERGTFLSPMTLLPISNGYVLTEGKIVPDTYKSTSIKSADIDVETYISAIDNLLQN